MSSAHELCVHCGNRVPTATRAIHERACIQQIRAVEMAARQRRRAAPPQPASHLVGAPPSFKIPGAPPPSHAQDNRNRTGAERSHGPGGVPIVENQNIHITGFPHPSSAPMSTFLHSFPSQPAAPAPAAPAAAARTPASHASAAPGGVASHVTAPAAAGVPDGSGASTAQDSATLPSANLPTPGPRGQPRNGAYETVFHPHARRDSVPTRLDYSQSIPLYDITHVNYEPWRPFATRTDYELAEFMLTSGLSRGQATTLFGILNRIVVDPKQLTVKSYDDVQKAWDSAASKQPAFHAENFTVEYGHEDKTYTFQHRDAWDWAESLVTDPLLCRHFAWHSYKQYRGINGRWVQFIDEPYTAERLYKFESSLPSDGVPLPFVIYADKTRLSSFGTQQAYPIIARLANLPSDIRNSNGHGGGQVIGFLPIVTNEKEKHKPQFATHKREVWHDAMRLALKKVIEYCRKGKKVLCGDGIWRRFFPLILMCVADYEEQAVMTLIRGVNGLFPCPVCLVPAEEQAELGLSPLYPLRNQEQGKEIVLNTTLSDRQKEERLKKISIRDVPNVFWEINWSDPHETNSFDRLHAYHTGLFSAHLLPEYQALVLANAPAVEMVHDQVDAIPRWAELFHPTDVATFKFSDGSKYEALSKASDDHLPMTLFI
ncbi:hypothetical protein K466DRAFT_666133 [Polyporus arcularius HHB13444]|uniref:Uncharacterized protein n=1 Tax=Polyporus arcularius HHB13444 TaxID=1314778 RepID=A0A5C3P015_9APHY|nr:hypothetical protein K466DRAFT_666133 [Polyporus arcularius HHB13444]